MSASIRFSFLVLFGTFIACDSEEEDPRIVLDACNLPKPCGAVYYPSPSLGEGSNLLPLGNAGCIHEVLERAEPAHLIGQTKGDAWGDVNWDLYTNGAGSSVLVSSHCGLVDGADPEDPDASGCTYGVERCTLRPVQELECAECTVSECSGGYPAP